MTTLDASAGAKLPSKPPEDAHILAAFFYALDLRREYEDLDATKRSDSEVRRRAFVCAEKDEANTSPEFAAWLEKMRKNFRLRIRLADFWVRYLARTGSPLQCDAYKFVDQVIEEASK